MQHTHQKALDRYLLALNIIHLLLEVFFYKVEGYLLTGVTGIVFGVEGDYVLIR